MTTALEKNWAFFNKYQTALDKIKATLTLKKKQL
jgi:hypothetical protein